MNYIPRRIKKYYGKNIEDDVLWCILNKSKLAICPDCHHILPFINFNPRFKGFKSECSCGYKKPSPLKGKSYLEIYGDNIPKIGYQKGENNISKRKDIREKIRVGVTNSYNEELRELRRQQAIKNKSTGLRFHRRYKADDGNFYRSSLEVKFVNWILTTEFRNNYEYEVVICLNNNHIKIVDFVINGDIYIEISGYAFEDWRDKFDGAINALRNTLPNNKTILVLTYEKHVSILKKRIFSTIDKNINIFTGSVEDLNQIYKKIKFCNFLNFNERINNGISIQRQMVS